jgi:hypothetical protein
MKIKSVAKSPLLPAGVSAPRTPLATDSVGLNVLSLLYKAKPTQEALTKGVNAIKNAINGLAAADIVETPYTGEKPASVARSDLPKASQKPPDAESSSSELFDDSDNETYQHRSNYLRSDSKDGKELTNRSDQQLDVLQGATQMRENEEAPLSNSIFLPALTTGGYWSGSESGPEDEEAVMLDRRKNRRGQRARQAIWEQKYGKKAKHLQTSDRHDRSAGWDPKKGAILQQHDKTGRSQQKTRDNWDRKRSSRPKDTKDHLDNSSAKQSNASTQRSKDNEGKVHPSWEAAKKAKEAKQTAQFTGNKITFD